METDGVDQLLERYLVLLDEYTALRELLNKTQVDMYQNIARANFSAERGIRYGPDYYDERMRASRILTVTSDDKGVPRFELVRPAEAVTAAEPLGPPADEGRPVHDDEAPAADDGAGSDDAEAEKKTKKQRSNDPLRWFGILAPLPLRQAQTLSVQAVQDIIPRLVSVNAEMVDVEIEVRRARKKRAKAEAAFQKKVDVNDVQGTEHGELRASMTEVEST